jgi:hypothetical protein
VAPGAVIAPIQKNLDKGAAGAGRLMKGARVPELEPEHCRFDVLADSRAVASLFSAGWNGMAPWVVNPGEASYNRKAPAMAFYKEPDGFTFSG